VNLLSKIAAGALVFLAASAANASFVTGSVGGDTVIYDNVANISWIQDTTIGGQRTWQDAQVWAAGLTYAGATAWRVATIGELASIDNPFGSGFTTSGTAGCQGAGCLYFGNLWSSTESTQTTAQTYYYAEYFSGAGTWEKSAAFGVLAVHSGDLLSSPTSAVPIPAAAWLMASGLGVFGAAARKRRARAA